MKAISMTTVPPSVPAVPGITRRRFFTALGGALGCCALPQNLSAREVRDYWPASREEQHQITLWCPPKMQAWLKKLDDLTVRHFERGLTCDWHAVIGRRARMDALPPGQRGMLASPSRPQGS